MQQQDEHASPSYDIKTNTEATQGNANEELSGSRGPPHHQSTLLHFHRAPVRLLITTFSNIGFSYIGRETCPSITILYGNGPENISSFTWHAKKCKIQIVQVCDMTEDFQNISDDVEGLVYRGEGPAGFGENSPISVSLKAS